MPVQEEERRVPDCWRRRRESGREVEEDSFVPAVASHVAECGVRLS